MPASKFLIVGLGAVGAVLARELGEKGAEVAGLVRSPNVKVKTVNLAAKEREAPKDLDVPTLVTIRDVEGFKPDVVILTLDHTALVSSNAKTLLSDLVRASPPHSVFCAFQPGLDTVDVYLSAGLTRDRIVSGGFYLISRARTSDEPNVKVFEYFLLDRARLFIGESSGKGAETLKSALAKHNWGYLGVPYNVWVNTSNLLFPYLVVCALDGWKNGGPTKERFALVCGAMSEVASMNTGILPKVLSWLVWSPWTVKAFISSHRRQFSPYMDFDEFGNQHHNLKVGQQNFDILVQIQEVLRKANKTTTYLDDIISQVRASQNYGRSVEKSSEST